MDRPLRIAVLAGYWSTNIGNSFFQLGAQYLLQRALPDAQVFLIGDQPGYWNVGRGNPANALDYAAHIEVDALAILGPFCRPEMEGIVGDVLRKQHARGTKILVLAAGMMTYDDETIALSRRILSDAPPLLMTTRDTQTYEALGDLAEHAFDGIDVATFVSDLFPRVPADLPPYVVLNFDQIPEPAFSPVQSAGANEQSFEWNGRTWAVRQPKLRTELSYKSRAFPFFDAWVPRGAGPDTMADYTILRTDHRYNPFLPRKSYANARSYVGDVPYTYLNMYANAACTFSNRVHACVATVSYGNEAMLFTRSPRAYLLDRLGLDGLRERPVRLDMDRLREEKDALIRFTTEGLASLAPAGVA